MKKLRYCVSDQSGTLGKLGVNMTFRRFLGVTCAKNLRENGISRPPWRASLKILKIFFASVVKITFGIFA